MKTYYKARFCVEQTNITPEEMIVRLDDDNTRTASETEKLIRDEVENRGFRRSGNFEAKDNASKFRVRHLTHALDFHVQPMKKFRVDLNYHSEQMYDGKSLIVIAEDKETAEEKAIDEVNNCDTSELFSDIWSIELDSDGVYVAEIQEVHNDLIEGEVW